jgi:exosortase E/protease (VPEID-CTERM system)
MSRDLTATARPYRLWPAGLLLVEYLWISLHFDALPLLAAGGLGGGLGHLGIIAPLFIVVATATYIASARSQRAELLHLLDASPLFGARQRLGLALNLASYATLWLLTARLLERAAQSDTIAWPWLAGWLLSAALTGASLLLTLLPVTLLRRVVVHARAALVLGVVAGSLAWAAGVASGQLWSTLQALTLRSVLMLMLPFSQRIVYAPDDAIIGTEDFYVQVAPECSGIEGIGLILVVISLYLISARKRLRFPVALALLPLSVLAVWLGNALRIALLIAVGAQLSPEIALSGFHSKAGWLFFCGIALGLIALVQRTRWFLRPDITAHASALEPGATWNPTATYLSPLLVLITTSLVTALFSTDFDRLYGLRIATVGAVVYLERKRLPRASWPVSWQAPAIGLLVFAAWSWLVPPPAAERVADFELSLRALGQPMAALWLALRALGAVVVVPLAEELAFRGFLLRRLIAADFSEVDKTRLTPLSIVVSSAAFALLHPGAWLAAGLAGLAYAYAQSLRGRIADAVVAHALTNALIAADVLLNHAYGRWL